MQPSLSLSALFLKMLPAEAAINPIHVLNAINKNLREPGSDRMEPEMRRKFSMSFQVYRNSMTKQEQRNLLISDRIEEWYNTVTGKNGRSSTEECINEDCGDFLSLLPVWGYGCWCSFGSQQTKGRGTPVNYFDEVCRDVTHCYRCAIMDGADEGEDCDPWNIEYTANIHHSSDTTGILDGCKNNLNSENCQWRTCSCEVYMFSRFWSFVFLNTEFDDQFQHDNGFDWHDNCVIDTTGERELDCCGYYPIRKEYHVRQGKDCCQERTIFNPNQFICCADGTTARLGDLC